MALLNSTPCDPRSRGPITRRTLHRIVCIAAGLYALVWALVSVLDPMGLCRAIGLPPNGSPQHVQAAGLAIGLYGALYFEVARHPERGFPLAAVALIGKLGISIAIGVHLDGYWSANVLRLCVINDLIWWIPFSLYLYDAWPFFRDDLTGANAPSPPVSDGHRKGAAVYAALLGDQFERLAPALQALHGHPKAKAKGPFEIGRAKGIWPWFLAATSPLPAADGPIELELAITTVGPYQIWSRTLQGRPMVSAQHARADGLVAERFGPLEVRLTLDVKDGEMHHQSAGVFFCLGPYRIRIPGGVTPMIKARVWADGDDKALRTRVVLLNRRGDDLMWYGGRVEIASHVTESQSDDPFTDAIDHVSR